jgi:dihydroorotate dehydrogenase
MAENRGLKPRIIAMPLIPYSLARPFLFGLDPEAAHDLTLATLARGQGTPLQVAWCAAPVHDPITLAGIDFPNRVGLAAGLDKNARCIDALGAMGFGFVEVGTVTPRPQPGNPKPRMFRLPEAQALINRLGFNNDGLEAFLANVQRARCRQSGAHSAMRLGLNIGKNASTPIGQATADYLTGLEGVYAHADYVTVNISSPNTQNLRALQSDAALDALLQALAERREALAARTARRVPLFIKIAPDLDEDQVRAIARSLREHGMDGVVATNTTVSREAVEGLPHAAEAGGLSGAPVRAASNRVIRLLRAELGVDFPIIGVGGILSADDAVEKIRAGADAVQIYTGLIYQGPALVGRAAQAIKALR